MKVITRSQVEKAVVEYFKVCHKDLIPAEIEVEIEKRMATLKAKETTRKPKRDKPDMLSDYALKRARRPVNAKGERV